MGRGLVGSRGVYLISPGGLALFPPGTHTGSTEPFSTKRKVGRVPLGNGLLQRRSGGLNVLSKVIKIFLGNVDGIGAKLGGGTAAVGVLPVEKQDP